MLEQLFGSKTRVRLLRLFLHNPDQAYFVRELTRRITAQINAVRNELDNLVTMGIIEAVPAELGKRDPSEPAGLAQRKYYRLNQDCLVYPELKALFQKSRMAVEHEFVRRLSAAGSVGYLALTGFFVGSLTAPTDLFIVGRIEKEKLVPLIRNFEREIGREINFTIMTPQEYRFRKEMTDKFLYSILEEQKMVLLDTVSERVVEPAL